MKDYLYSGSFDTFAYRGRISLTILTALLLSACTSMPAKDEPPEASVVVQEPQEQISKPRVEPERPRIELTEEILFKLLLAEVAGQRGRFDIAVENYLDLAHSTRDPKVVERATRIAVFARNNEAAQEAAILWVELDPQNPDAHQILAVMALRGGKTEEALEHLEIIIEESEGMMGQKLWMIANFLGRDQDRQMVIDVMQQLMEDHQDDAEALFAYAQVAARLDDLQRSHELLEQALALKPEDNNISRAYVGLLQKQGKINEAIVWLEEVLHNREDDFSLRHAYARLLTDAKRFDEARRQFEILAVQAPNNTDILYALGLLYLQANRLDDASAYFSRLLKLKKNVNEANYYLGRIAEEKNELVEAGDWYQGVHEGENYFDARVRLSMLLTKQGKVDEGLEHIRDIQTTSQSDKNILIQAEGEILTEAKRFDEAMAVYDKALADKSDPDLLYSRAMLAEKMGRLDLLERDLSAILKDDPDNAQALNALGYTLADRTDRYQEAYELIKRALELNPDDFYILDSMGWVLYRLGKLDEAVEHLRKALELRNDPEIAAHLGEVLWVIGDKQAARKIWDTALQDTPEDARLLKVINRFNP
ncbi:MAG: tetratricopeptide repeat protein [Gammaproteobacteria bacterium]